MTNSTLYRDCLKRCAKDLPAALFNSDVYRDIWRSASELGWHLLTLFARILVMLTYPVSVFVIAFGLKKSNERDLRSAEEFRKGWMKWPKS